jgi:ElaB/YqjD/DUF883 family membrane-anchored ribosome-binding protein
MSKHSHHNKGASKTREIGQGLVDSAADQAGEAAEGAGNRIFTAFQSARNLAVNVRDKTVASAKATDKAIVGHPYKALAIAAGAGLLIGLFLAGRRPSKKE